MGVGNSAMAKATLNNTVNSYVSAVQNSTNNALASSINTVNLTCEADVCDFSNIDIQQKATSYATTQFSNTNDATILQKVSASLDNSAQSLVSGLGMGNSTQSESNIVNYVNTAMDLAQNITNNCASVASNTVNLSAIGKEGRFAGTKINQDASSILDCIGKNANSLIASQVTEVVAKNSASAVTKGIEFPNLFAVLGGLIAVVLVVIALIFVPIALLGKQVTEILPVIAPVGLFFISMYLFFLAGSSKVTELETVCEETLKDVETQKEKKKLFIKPYFYTCGIYQKGYKTTLSTSTTPPPSLCKQKFVPIRDTMVGSFTDFSPSVITRDSGKSQGGNEGCSFTILDPKTSFTSISNAFNWFRNTSNCVAMDAIYNLDGTLQYIFFSEVNPICLTSLQSDFQDPELKTWAGEGDVSNISLNPIYPPLVCVVLPPIKGVPSNTDPEAKPYYIRISVDDGFVYYYKNKQWVKANQSNFWANNSTWSDTIKSAVTSYYASANVNNVLIYKGNPSTTPNILDKEKNPKLDLTQPIIYFDVEDNKTNTIDVYVCWKPEEVSTNDKMQGFSYLTGVDISSMKNEGVIPFGANPLTKFMNRTWVKLTSDTDPDLVEQLLTPEQLTSFNSFCESEQQKFNYDTCNKNVKTIEGGKTQKNMLIVFGSLTLFLSIAGVGLNFMKKSKKSDQNQEGSQTASNSSKPK